MLYARKLRRELWRQKGQSLAVIAVTALGVFLFIASAAGYLDLDGSYQETRERLALADLHIDSVPLEAGELEAAGKVPGVKAAQARFVTPFPVNVGAARDQRVELRVISLPDVGEPALDRVLLVAGNLPQGAGEVVLEKHLALHHGLEPGDTLTLGSAGADQTLRVSGVGVSAEYLWVSRDENDLMPSPQTFGVGWMRRGGLQELARAAGPSPGLAAPASEAAGNQLLVELRPGHSAAEVLRNLKAAVGEHRLLRATREQDLPGVRLLQMDVDGYKGMAAFFPLFFLGVGAFIVASVLSRLVDAQRPIVGTLMALGVGRARVLWHYLAYSLVLGVFGALLGAVLGVASGQALTQEYAKELGIPFVTARLHWDLAAWGLLIGVAVAAVAGWLPAYRASRLHPAESMRPPRPSTGPLARLSRRLRVPLPLRLAVRSVLGRPFRTLGTALGVAAALVLVITTGAMLDSMRVAIETLFERAQTFDARVDLVAPLPLEQARSRFAALAGVREVEGVLGLPVRLNRGDRTADVLLQGLEDGAKLIRSMDMDGTPAPPQKGGIALTRAAARRLAVEPGQVVTVTLLPSGPPAQFKVTGFADAAMGPTASVRLGDAQQAFDLPGLVTGVAFTADPAGLEGLRKAVAAMPEAARLYDLAALRKQLDQLMGLGLLMLGTMLFFSVVLAAAILFNTATLNIMERRRDLATLRAMGRSMGEIAFGLTLEHAILAVLGFALGMPLAAVATREVLALYSGDLFTFPYVMSSTTVGAAALGVGLVLLLAQWPALRLVARTPLAEAVRTREG